MLQLSSPQVDTSISSLLPIASASMSASVLCGSRRLAGRSRVLCTATWSKCSTVHGSNAIAPHNALGPLQQFADRVSRRGGEKVSGNSEAGRGGVWCVCGESPSSHLVAVAFTMSCSFAMAARWASRRCASRAVCRSRLDCARAAMATAAGGGGTAAAARSRDAALAPDTWCSSDIGTADTGGDRRATRGCYTEGRSAGTSRGGHSRCYYSSGLLRGSPSEAATHVRY